MGSGPHLSPIDQLKRHLAEMTDVAVAMVADGTRALLTNDLAVAESVIARDGALDKFDNDLEVETMRRIATLQPEGADLRTLGAMLKIGNCVDRVGRLGYDIARTLSAAPEPAAETTLALLAEMDAKARAMVQEAIAAFLANDAARAKAVLGRDDEVDALYRQLQAELVRLIGERSGSPERLAHSVLVGRHLERVADNACKIAEKAVYAITGERRPEYFSSVVHSAHGAPGSVGAP